LGIGVKTEDREGVDTWSTPFFLGEDGGVMSASERHEQHESDLVAAAFAAARDPRVASALEAIYASVASEIATRGPACWASGRCCNFRKAGHDLFVTLLEAAYCVQRLDAAATDARGAQSTRNANNNQQSNDSPHATTGGDAAQPTVSSHAAVLSLVQVDVARERGDCPYLTHNLCGAHGVKPLGCRVYFCDQSAQEWQHELTERALADIRALHERFNVPYIYDEWRRQLTRCVSLAR
jgi:Fe-S-cluster containining protein